MLINERMDMEIKRLTEENSALRKLLETKELPDGLLQCRKSQNRVVWFIQTRNSKGGLQSSYLPKTQRSLAAQLAQKTYCLQRLRDNEQTIDALETCLKRLPAEGGRSSAMRRDPGFADLLRTKDLERELAEWANAAYEKNPHHKDHMTVRAANGEMVRSKSEAFILSTLHAAGIPFRYECEFELDGTVVYPDFMIRRPSDGKLILWEHFGLMSQIQYRANAMGKLQKYIENGFYPMDNLITTFERDNSSLDFSHVMDLVEWLRSQ